MDLIFAEIDLPVIGGDWRAELTKRAESARRVLARHPWAIALLESRTSPGAGTLRHHNAVLGTLRTAGFPVVLAAHAYALLDSYVYGFALQESMLPFDGPETATKIAEPMMKLFSTGEYPYLVEMSTEHFMRPGYDFGKEFEFGLTLILDGLTARL